MGYVYVSQYGGNFTTAQDVFVHHGGSWRQVQELWAKSGGTWNHIFPNSAYAIYKDSGSYTFTVGPNIHQLNVSYPVETFAGTYPFNTYLNTVSYPVTPGESIPITIGDWYQNSTFGTITAAPFIAPSFYFQTGNVDRYDRFTMKMVNNSTTTSYYTGTGKQSDHLNGAIAQGITLWEDNETAHGDLTSTIHANTITESSIEGHYGVNATYYTGRNQPELISQYPLSSNGWYGIWQADDNSISGEGAYSYGIWFIQKPPFIVTW